MFLCQAAAPSALTEMGTPSSACCRSVAAIDCAGVPDVFRSPFQTSPLDLDTDAFYPARRTHLDTQLTRIADGQAGACSDAVRHMLF
jgi:hypothetical protein